MSLSVRWILPVCLLWAPAASAQTVVAGGIIGDTLWQAAYGPYQVQGDLTVQAGSTLTIEPGTVVVFAGTDDQLGGLDPALPELIIAGSLDARGTAGSPITFAADGSVAAGSWYGIVVEAGATSALVHHATLSHAVTGIQTATPGAEMGLLSVAIDTVSASGITVSAGTPTLDTVTVTGSSASAVVVSGSGAPSLVDCVLTANTGFGIHLTNTAAVSGSVDHCTIADNGAGVVFDSAVGASWSVIDSNLTGNTGSGASFSGTGDLSVRFSNVWGNGSNIDGATTSDTLSANPLYVGGANYRLTSNSPSRFAASDGTDLGALPYGSDATPGLVGTLWVDTTLAAGTHTLDGDLTVAPGVTLTLEPGATLEFSDQTDLMAAYADTGRAELRVGGTLEVLGISSNPVSMSSVGTTTSSWYGVHLLDGSSGHVIESVSISESLFGIRSETTGATTIDGASVRRVGQAGLSIEAGAPSLDRIQVTNGDGHGVHYSGTGAGDLTNCIVNGNAAIGLYFTQSGTVAAQTVAHCTVDGNDSGVVVDSTAGNSVDVVNSALTNHGSHGAQLAGAGTLQVRFSNLFGNTTDNDGATLADAISSDPGYVSASDVHLQGSSAMVDAGTAAGASDHDFEGRFRPLDGDTDGSAVHDMGAYEFDGGVAALNVSPAGPHVTTEAGGSVTLDISLGSAPLADVVVDVRSLDLGEGTVSPSTLTFTPGAWDDVLQVVVDGVDDDVDDGDVAYQIQLDPAASADTTYAGLAPVLVDLTNTNDDIAAILPDPTGGLITVEDGTQAFIDVVLGSEPTDAVRLAVSSTDTAEATVAPAQISFDSTNWDRPVRITVTGEDDVALDGDQTYQIELDPSLSLDADYAALALVVIDGTNLDDEVAPPGFQVLPGSVTTTEAGGTASFTVALRTQPVDTVEIAVASSDSGEATTDVSSLSFGTGDWDTPKTVNVRGVDDDIDDGDASYTIVLGPVTTTDPDYQPLDPTDVSGTNTDDDTASVTVAGGPLTTTEAGTSDTFTIQVGSQPASPITISLASSDPGEATVSPPSLVIDASNWESTHTVTVTGADDAAADGDQAFTISVGPITGDAVYAAIDPDDVAGTNIDDDVAMVLTDITATLITAEDGSTATFEVSLGTLPTGNVAIGISSTNTDEGQPDPDTLLFDPYNWFIPQTVTVEGIDDLVDDGDVTYDIVVSVLSAPLDPDYAALPPDAYLARNLDDDGAGFVIAPASGLITTESGGTASFGVSLLTAPTADVTIALASDTPSEGTAAPPSLRFTTGNWDQVQTVTVTGVDDLVEDGNVSYNIVLEPAVSDDIAYDGQDPNDVSVTNVDDDGAGPVQPTPASGLVTSEQGATDAFTLVLNTRPNADVTIELASTDTTEGLVSPSRLVFTSANWNQARTVTVTGVGDTRADGDVAYTVALSVTSDDPFFDALLVPGVGVTNLDDDEAGFFVDPIEGVVTSEDGLTDEVWVSLTSEPAAQVTITVTTDTPAEATVDPAQLTFTPIDWNRPKAIAVEGVDDNAADGNQGFLITFGAAVSNDAAYDGLVADDASGVNLDDEGGIDDTGVVTTTGPGPGTGSGSPSGTATATGGQGPGTGNATGTGGELIGAPDTGEYKGSTCGCSATSSGGAAGALVWLLALGIAGRRRRR